MRNRLAVAPPSARSTPTSSGQRGEYVRDLMRDRLERGAHEVRPRRAARDPADQTARLGPPLRRAETGQSGNEVDAAGRLDARSRAARSRPPSRSRRARREATAALRRPRAPSPRPRMRAARPERPRQPWSAGRRRRAARSPRLTRTNVPVPYVAFASPGAKQPWPKRAACWSPAIPATGSVTPRNDASAACPDEATTSGSTARSTPNRARSSSSQSPVARSSSIVRDAFVTSVTCVAPPVSFHTSHASIVPKASSDCGCSLAPGSTRASSPRSTGRGRAPFARGSGLPGAPRSARRCAGPARRSRGAPASRCAAPRRRSSRAGS